MANRKSAPTPMQKQFAETLEEQRFEMFLHVARELTGRAKQRQLQKGKALDRKVCGLSLRFILTNFIKRYFQIK